MCFHVVGALHVVEHRVGLTVSFRTRRQTYTHGQLLSVATGSSLVCHPIGGVMRG